MVLFCLNVLETIFENMSLFAICYTFYKQQLQQDYN